MQSTQRCIHNGRVIKQREGFSGLSDSQLRAFIAARSLISGNFHPVNSLIVPCSDLGENRDFLSKVLSRRTLSNLNLTKTQIFPVFSPVSREFDQRVGSHKTASTAICNAGFELLAPTVKSRMLGLPHFYLDKSKRLLISPFHLGRYSQILPTALSAEA